MKFNKFIIVYLFQNLFPAMAKTFIMLLFAALFVFSSVAHSLRRPETVQFSDDFSDDFLAGFGGGGRSSFGGSRPSMSFSRPSVSAPRPSISAPRPAVNIPRPQINVPKPVPRPQINVPKPPVSIPKPIPKPTPVITKPTPVVAKPTPTGAPAKTITTPVTPQKAVATVSTPANNVPKTNPTGAPSTQIKTSVSVNNGQISGQAGITKTSGPNTVSAQATYDQGKLGAQGTITRTTQNGHVEAGTKFGNDAKPEIHVGGSKTMGADTIRGKVGVADGKLGAQGTLTRTIPNGQIEAGAKVGSGAKPEFYVGGSKTVGADSVTGKVGVANGKVSAQGAYTRTTDVGQVSVGGRIGDGKPQLDLGLAKDLRGGGQGTLNLNVKEGGVGGSVGYNTPIGKTGTLSTEVGYSQDKGTFGQITAKIPF